MTGTEALAFIEKHGVVLLSARGPVPRLTEALAGESIKGSWWAHPKSHQIFSVLQIVTASEDVLMCRLVDGKVTLVHRRLWPALVRVAKHFALERLAKVSEEHTSSGRHQNRVIAFPKWVPKEVKQDAKGMSEDEAFAALGAWASAPSNP